MTTPGDSTVLNPVGSASADPANAASGAPSTSGVINGRKYTSLSYLSNSGAPTGSKFNVYEDDLGKYTEVEEVQYPVRQANGTSYAIVFDNSPQDNDVVFVDGKAVSWAEFNEARDLLGLLKDIKNVVFNAIASAFNSVTSTSVISSLFGRVTPSVTATTSATGSASVLITAPSSSDESDDDRSDTEEEVNSDYDDNGTEVGNLGSSSATPTTATTPTAPTLTTSQNRIDELEAKIDSDLTRVEELLRLINTAYESKDDSAYEQLIEEFDKLVSLNYDKTDASIGGQIRKDINEVSTLRASLMNQWSPSPTTTTSTTPTTAATPTTLLATTTPTATTTTATTPTTALAPTTPTTPTTTTTTTTTATTPTTALATTTPTTDRAATTTAAAAQPQQQQFLVPPGMVSYSKSDSDDKDEKFGGLSKRTPAKKTVTLPIQTNTPTIQPGPKGRKKKNNVKVNQ